MITTVSADHEVDFRALLTGLGYDFKSSSDAIPASLRFTLDEASVLAEFKTERGRVELSADVMDLSLFLSPEKLEAVARLILSLNDVARFDHGMIVGMNVDRGVFVTKSLSVQGLDPMELKGEMSMMMESIPMLRRIISSLVEQGEQGSTQPFPFQAV